uniref:Uncharacterized protein n=1 Tax=Arundo donax TaxID=35708 RepID=A0A0A9BF79_ARUDO
MLLLIYPYNLNPQAHGLDVFFSL